MTALLRKKIRNAADAQGEARRWRRAVVVMGRLDADAAVRREILGVVSGEGRENCRKGKLEELAVPILYLNIWGD